MLAATLREVTVPQWRVHVELQTSSLADDVQLTALAAHLDADTALEDAHRQLRAWVRVTP